MTVARDDAAIDGIRRRTRYERHVKRVLDVMVASIALLPAVPLLALAAVCIWVEDRGPVFFRQDRVGRDGVVFHCLKLRSMPPGERRDIASADGHDLAITRVGVWLRRTQLDEVPQLINVLRGDMSLVGPRPGLPSQVVLHEARRTSGAIALRPGLTGLAQISGYDGMTEEVKAGFDARYADRVTFGSDLSIVLHTLPFLLKKPPIY